MESIENGVETAADSSSSSFHTGLESSCSNEVSVTGTEAACINGEDQSDSDIPEDEYLVENVIDYVREDGEDLYLIKWKGWDSKFNSWEPQSNLHCMEKLLDFFKERDQKARPSKRLKMNPKVAREEAVVEFEKKYMNPTEEEILECFSKYKNGGRLNFGGQMKPIHFVHKEIANFMYHNGRSGAPALTSSSRQRLRRLRQQLLIRIVERRRAEQLLLLGQWQRSLAQLTSETGKIIVENVVDLALPPKDFQFVNDYLPGPGVVIPNDPVIGCECSSCDIGAHQCCGPTAGAQFAYTRYGKLRIGVGQPIYECNRRCKCPKDCFNRVVQNGRKVKVAIFRTQNGCGWGVRALEAMKRGQFVSEYVGEVITNDDAERRGRQYDAAGTTYLFDLDFNDSNNLYTVDAAVYGNVSHFINHSCEPNLVVYGVWVDCLDPNLPRLALFASRDIRRGEELSFDYNSPLGRTQGTVTSPSTAARNNADSAIKTETEEQPSSPPASPTKSPRHVFGQHPQARSTCRCGAKSCRRYLF